jgi:hypothetical protein
LRPFRDELAAAIERADRLARDNAALRARPQSARFDPIPWMLVGLIGLCVLAISYLCMLP